jgi:hypothetical protein
MRCLPILAVVFFGATAAAAQSIAVTPGDGTVDASRIAPYDNAFVSTQLYPDGRIVYPGIWTDQVRLREIKGRKLLVRTQGLAYYDGRSLVSVNVLDPRTFAPVSDTQRNPDGSIEKWTFDGNHAEGHLTGATGAKDAVKTFDSPTPFFDFNCCMRSIVMSMIAKKPGLSVTLPAFDGTDGFDKADFKVLRREPVHAGALGTVDAWLVETPLLSGYIHFWLIDKPPYMVRMTLSANAVNAYAQSFDMIGADGAVMTPPPVENAFGHGEPPPPQPK